MRSIELDGKHACDVFTSYLQATSLINDDEHVIFFDSKLSPTGAITVAIETERNNAQES